MAYNQRHTMIRLDNDFKEKAVEQLSKEEITEGMTPYTLKSKLTASNLLNFVISYRYIFPESGKIIPLIPLGELFYEKSTVVEPRNIVCHFTLLFSDAQDKVNFFKWSQRLAQRSRLLPGPETNTEIEPVYPISYELEYHLDALQESSGYVLKEHHLNDIGWLERRCPGRWYFQNNMLFFLDREPLMEWKLRHHNG